VDTKNVVPFLRHILDAWESVGQRLIRYANQSVRHLVVILIFEVATNKMMVVEIRELWGGAGRRPGFPFFLNRCRARIGIKVPNFTSSWHQDVLADKTIWQAPCRN
jgi:hypothetical protein